MLNAFLLFSIVLKEELDFKSFVLQNLLINEKWIEICRVEKKTAI